MPLLKVKVRKLSADSVLSGARTSASIARELADIAQFPPARAAATIVLLIFETIEVRFCASPARLIGRLTRCRIARLLRACKRTNRDAAGSRGARLRFYSTCVSECGAGGIARRGA